jgi:glycosyltransferase involved in cell wall biosynthesis
LQNPDRPLHLLFAGSGELGAEMRSACNVVFDAEDGAAPPSGSVDGSDGAPPASFAGFLNQTEVSKAYAAADLLVLPSDYGETWGLVVNEAMASGLPCLASDSCGCTEDLITPLDSDYRFRVGDPASLATAILTYLDRPLPTAKLHDQVERFNLSVSVATVRRLYDATIDQTSRRH